MSEAYLEVTYRHGLPLAAYYYYTRSGRAIGIEITAPSMLSLTAMNRVLRELGQRPVNRAELSPLLAA